MPSHPAKARGFTLIELLVVIAIIAILASILFPVFARARENARRSSCQSNLKQLGISMQMYSQDYDEHMVSTAAGDVRWPTLLAPYMKLRGIVRCPSALYSLKFNGNTNGPAAGDTTTYDMAVNDPTGVTGTSTHEYIYSLYSSYGYNYVYMAPTGYCPDGFESPDYSTSKPCQVSAPSTDNNAGTSPAGTSPSGPSTASPLNGVGVVISRIESPSNTIAMAESVAAPTIGSSVGQLNWGYYIVRPPAVWAKTVPTPQLADSYGRVYARHLDTGNVLFADGHVKAMRVSDLSDPVLWRLKK